VQVIRGDLLDEQVADGGRLLRRWDDALVERFYVQPLLVEIEKAVGVDRVF